MMHNQALGTVSIIMPVYNGEHYLRQALDSVLAQTYPWWELIVVDDGSKDNSAAIIQSYSDHRFRYVYQENRGQAAALNTGLELATGEYIATLDADDWLPNESLQVRVDYLNSHPECGVVYCDGYFVDSNGTPFVRFSEQMPVGETGDVYDTLIVSPFYGTGGSILIRKDSMDERSIRYDDNIVWCQDWDIYIRLAETLEFGYAPAISIFYRVHAEGMTLVMPAGRRLESLLSLRKKVVNSSRFQSVSVPQKSAFFYDYLVRDLRDRNSERELLFNSPAFLALPASDQARLIRNVAIDALLKGANPSLVRQWLMVAWRRAAFAPKTAAAWTMVTFMPALAKQALAKWQVKSSGPKKDSPFETLIQPRQN